jgi:predicted DNA-binding antitoxin AbrB/MazE fold protein
MSKVITVVFDGTVFVPETPVDLKPGARYVITIGKALQPGARPEDWDEIDDATSPKSLHLDAPEDWSRGSSNYFSGPSGR